MVFLHKPKPVTFTLATDALWEWKTDRRHGEGDPWDLFSALETQPGIACSGPSRSVRMLR